MSKPAKTTQAQRDAEDQRVADMLLHKAESSYNASISRKLEAAFEIEAMLDREADRYLALAQKEALKNLLTPTVTGERLAREHVVRSHTMREAARLVSNWEPKVNVAE